MPLFVVSCPLFLIFKFSDSGFFALLLVFPFHHHEGILFCFRLGGVGLLLCCLQPPLLTLSLCTFLAGPFSFCLSLFTPFSIWADISAISLAALPCFVCCQCLLFPLTGYRAFLLLLLAIRCFWIFFAVISSFCAFMYFWFLIFLVYYFVVWQFFPFPRLISTRYSFLF